MSKKNAFGKVIKSIRESQYLSQDHVANESNLDRTYISLLERGLRQPTLPKIDQIARALGILTSELFMLVEYERATKNKLEKKSIPESEKNFINCYKKLITDHIWECQTAGHCLYHYNFGDNLFCKHPNSKLKR